MSDSVTAETSSVIRNIIVERIANDYRTPDVDVNNKAVKWYLTYHTKGERKVPECTEKVWIWAQAQKPWNDSRARWILNVETKGSDVTIVGVMRQPMMAEGPLSPRLNIDPNHLMLQKLGSTFEPINLPAVFQTPVLEEAVEAMNKAGNARAGEVIANRFRVNKVIDLEDGGKIFVLEVVS